jgi:hypothetical protein
VSEPTAKAQGIRVERDYGAEFVALAPKVPEGERAWPVYLRAYEIMGWMPEEVADMPRLGSDGWAVASEYMKPRLEAIALIRRAAAMERLGYPLSTEFDPAHTAVVDAIRPPETMEEGAVDEEQEEITKEEVGVRREEEGPARVFELRFGYLGPMRAMTRALWMDLALAMEVGDGARVARDIEAMLGVSRHVCEYPMEIADHVSCAVVDVALNAVEWVLAEKPQLLSGPDTTRIMRMLETAPMEGRVRPRMEFTRYEVLDVLQRGFSDDGKGDGTLKLEAIKELDLIADSPGNLEKTVTDNPAFAKRMFAKAAKRKQVIAEFDRITAPARWHKPMWEMKSWPEVEPSKKDERVKWTIKYPVLDMLMPNMVDMTRFSERSIQRRDAARVALALELMRRETGTFPEKLEELTPRYLAEVGKDRFTGEALKYKVVDGRAVLYSCGPDLDDDGGRGVERTGDVKRWPPPRAKERKNVVEGDWVLFEVGATLKVQDSTLK